MTAIAIHVVIISRLDYCNVLYVGLSLEIVCKLQLVQNATARLLLGTGGEDYVTFILKDLHLLPISF